MPQQEIRGQVLEALGLALSSIFLSCRGLPPYFRLKTVQKVSELKNSWRPHSLLMTG